MSDDVPRRSFRDEMESQILRRYYKGKRKLKENVEKNRNVIIQAFVALAVPMIIFFPFNLQSMLLWLLGILVLVILVAVAVAFFTKSEGALPIRDFLFSALFKNLRDNIRAKRY